MGLKNIQELNNPGNWDVSFMNWLNKWGTDLWTDRMNVDVSFAYSRLFNEILKCP